ncbi:UDP-N-acetylglucosamine 2-epimerase [Gelidibacter maritimus]|uniref:UDP-N-acetylglucosamine 2-epimerase (Hydrolyzing) n=1 Tax=Gelidibacter maritimus TaxID=2761487 RepID=A0A7W2M640_9FLAO|nr:UDP-N-acetylglucosamine 2-epimerase [Gelidibacter maritimus]MBA6153405.1 UDP-N-acetylglucosamine 2-epimerase (hydrolyzing) [Gelidibacter maritimus]
MKRKVCVITGTRAEYGLLYWTMRAIESDIDLKLQVVVTGMHLSPEFGNTYKEIENDGFQIDKKVEMLLSSDTPVGISKSMGLGMISFAETFEDLKPDIILVLGDRFEIFSSVSAAMIARIPIAHCHGGEATEGLIDEPIRHSITKMSHIHFPSTCAYQNRIIQLGETPENVHNVGALGIENIKKLKLLSKEDFEESINFKLDEQHHFLVTFHPVTLEKSTAEKQISQLLEVFEEMTNVKVIFTKANSDTDGRIINTLVDEFVKKYPGKSVVFASLGQLRYLSALQFIDVVVGNSSSGLIEVPSFKKATVNIGDRQKGRIKAESVIDCDPDKLSISNAIRKALSKDFQETLKKVANPYEKENSSESIVSILKNVELDNLIKKKFYDLE